MSELSEALTRALAKRIAEMDDFQGIPPVAIKAICGEALLLGVEHLHSGLDAVYRHADDLSSKKVRMVMDYLGQEWVMCDSGAVLPEAHCVLTEDCVAPFWDAEEMG